MSELAVAIPSSGELLRGTLHLPDGLEKKRSGLVIVHDYGGEKVGPHRMFVKLARKLVAANEQAVLRFDMRGCGESPGDFEAMTMDTQVEDTMAAFAYLRGHTAVDPSHMALLGFSLGGCVAALCAPSLNPKTLLLWSPVLYPKEVLERSWKEEIPGGVDWVDGKLDHNGLLVGWEFYESLAEAEPLQALTAYPGPVLVIHGSQDERVPPANGEAAANATPQGKLFLVEGADHTYTSSPWESALIDKTIEWLGKVLRN
jgi:pimeloyl-ACP methyl ester carboxylesterase